MGKNFLNQDISTIPLATRMRPRNLDEFFGQDHLVGEGRLLRRAIERDSLTSSIFYGPAGTGKTTIATIIENNTKNNFYKLNASTSGLADLREIIKKAEYDLMYNNKSTYLFLDECHRWTKSQSDSILGAIETGVIKFIGATTENPNASMTPAIVSRCRIYNFKAHTTKDIISILKFTLNDKERGYGNFNIKYDDNALELIAVSSCGDIRNALSSLESCFVSSDEENGCKIIDINIAKESIQNPNISIDIQGYYDIISAFIKSMRGSDSDAALFWLARLLHSGIDPRIIARRVMVHASEDVGLADPNALLIANAAVKAVEFVGMPEARIPLAQAVIYICEAPKSNSVIQAIDNAMEDAKNKGAVSVPNHLRDHSYTFKGDIREEYLYPHDYDEHIVKQSYLPKDVEGVKYYFPTSQGFEKSILNFKKYREEKLEKQ